jgi:hypothetical protein
MPRKQKKYHFIYKTTNLINNKFYVGMHSTDNLGDGYFGSGKIINYSVDKHGVENHKVEILEFLSSRAELKKREAEIVNEGLLADPLNMNLKFGGDGGWDHTKDMDLVARNKKCNEARSARLKDDAAFREEYFPVILSNLSKGRARRKEMHRNSNCKLGSKLSEEHKENLRKSKNVGASNSQFGTCWICIDDEAKKVKKEELQFWLENGWRLGRKYK